MYLLMGCDPELFVKRRDTGVFVSAHTLLPGTKEKPHKVMGGAIQVDGVAAEFNIDPAEAWEQWEYYITTVLNQLEGALGFDYQLEVCPSVVFDPSYFDTLPENVRELGCNMDYNAWTGQPNEAPKGNSTTMRTAAGHIHIGWTNGEDVRDPRYIEDCCELVKQLDYYLGIPSLMWDNDPRRRLLYGCAGAFRPKSYGLEYRTLSNRWLINKSLRRWVYQAAKFATAQMFGKGNRMVDRYGDMAQRVVNGNEYDYARSIEFRNEVWADTGMDWPTW